MRELSRFDAREVRRLVAMHVMMKIGLNYAADSLKPARIDRDLYLAAYTLAEEIRGLCT